MRGIVSVPPFNRIRQSKRVCLRQGGSSLIEVLIAMGIFALGAMVILPYVVQARRISKPGQFTDVCINAVRSKIHEYKFGALSDLSVNPALTVESRLNRNRGSGFAYAKLRYNLQHTAYCPVDTSTTTAGIPLSVTSKPLPADLTSFGREECISGIGNSALPSAFCSASPTDVITRSMYPAFRLFVNLRRVNSLLGAEDCPWHTTTSSYDFQQAEDAIKITVTGVLDLSTSFTYGDINSSSVRTRDLECHASDYIRPVGSVARYWMQSDGRIFRWQGTGEGGSDANSSFSFQVFRNLFSPNNMGFTVSPDNRFIYILRPGALVRYSGCTGDPIDCDVTTETVFRVNSGLTSITAKWLMSGNLTTHSPNRTCGNPTDGLPIIFGLMGDRVTPVCIDLPNEAGGTTPVTLRYDRYVTGGATTRIPFQVPTTGRVYSIFMDPLANRTYVLDLTCQNTLGVAAERTHCAAIYDSNDAQMLYPLNIFSVRAIAFSK
jgi:type II secretory pathway pseudopilin PulG